MIIFFIICIVLILLLVIIEIEYLNAPTIEKEYEILGFDVIKGIRNENTFIGNRFITVIDYEGIIKIFKLNNKFYRISKKLKQISIKTKNDEIISLNKI